MTAPPATASRQGDSVGTDGVFIGVTPHGGHPSKTRAWIDFQNDSRKDVKLVREVFRSIEHVKRTPTTGMATDQSRPRT